jgi:hypothetical protein
MAASFDVPYFAPDPPSVMPTDAEIDAAPDITLAYRSRRVVQVGDHFVVKFGVGIDLAEGRNMLFVREQTNVPVPRVYGLYSRGPKNYIVMERIASSTLMKLWPDLQHSEKEAVTRLLRTHFDELRNLPPPDYYGSLGRRALLDGIFWTLEPEATINGPFSSEEALTEALALKYSYNGHSDYRAEYYRQYLPQLFRNHRPTFTHGDVQRKNIMIQRVVDNSHDPSLPQWHVCILDWEKSGWYPTYWEYAIGVCTSRWDDDWCLWFKDVLDPYIPEAAWLQDIRLELWS